MMRFQPRFRYRNLTCGLVGVSLAESCRLVWPRCKPRLKLFPFDVVAAVFDAAGGCAWVPGWRLAGGGQTQRRRRLADGRGATTRSGAGPLSAASPPV